MLLLFFGTLQLADYGAAQLLVDHAATRAARAASVVLPDDGIHYRDAGNLLVDRFAGDRKRAIEGAADEVLANNPRLVRSADNVMLDRPAYRANDPLAATVRAPYRCLLPLVCGADLELEATRSLVYQGADYAYPDHQALRTRSR